MRLLDDNGSVRRFVNVYVSEEDIRFLQDAGLTGATVLVGDEDILMSHYSDIPCRDGDEISIIPAIAGG